MLSSKDKKILSHLVPFTDSTHYVDTYFCNIYFKNKDYYMYTVAEKVENWVVENGGRFRKLSDKKIFGERKGFLIKIVFPCFGKRDMKNIMATLFYKTI